MAKRQKAPSSLTSPPPKRKPGRRPRVPVLPGILLLSDDKRLADPAAAISRLPRGAAVVLRHYADPDRAALARGLARSCRARGLLLLVAARDGDGVRLARAVGADGLHLTEAMVRRRDPRWRIWRRPGWLITAAAHSEAALLRARRLGCAAALLSPVFASLSHPGAAPIGPLRFALWSGRCGLPVYALGGMDLLRLRRISAAHPAGLAGISLFMQNRRHNGADNRL